MRDQANEMDFPARPTQTQKHSDALIRAFEVTPEKVYVSSEDLMAVFDSEKTIKKIQPDFSLLEQIDCRGGLSLLPREIDVISEMNSKMTYGYI